MSLDINSLNKPGHNTMRGAGTEGLPGMGRVEPDTGNPDFKMLSDINSVCRPDNITMFMAGERDC